MSKKCLNGLFVVILFIFMINLVIAEEINLEEKAKICINKSQSIVNELNNSNFSIIRANDLLKNAETLFYSQKILMEKKQDYNFSLVLSICDEIEILKENALSSRDSFMGLTKFYNDTFDGKIDASSVDKIMSNIQKEISNERYELVSSLVNSAYEEILKVKSENTSLKLFYASTTRSLGNFFKNNLTFFIVFFVILLFILIFYKTAITRFELRIKLKRLELRRESIRDLIKKAQKDYFEKGIISEADYAVRTENFGEMIRDIDRQIPLLKEEIMQLWMNKKVKNKSEDLGMLRKRHSKKIKNQKSKTKLKK